VGVYDIAALNALGINSVNSIMVPIDYKVTIQSAAVITDGDVICLSETSPNLNGFNVAVMKVEFV
jgi:predicted membrane protein